MSALRITSAVFAPGTIAEVATLYGRCLTRGN